MLCAVIMAGGKGTRFWPASTKNKPKQFLNLISDKTMIQLTVERLLIIMPIEHIFICTSKEYENLVHEQIPDLPFQNCIIEPEGRNTAPCILLSSLYIQQIFDNAEIIVVPSDSAVNDCDNYISTLDAAYNFLKLNSSSILTIGIKPTRAEIGYGYIKMSDNFVFSQNKKIFKVDKFVEKPSVDLAKYYLNEGNYLWNSGIFVFNVNFMIKQYELFANDIYSLLIKLPDINESSYEENLEILYRKCESVSVDYAIMEHSKDIYVIPSNFGWDDVGSWKALERYMVLDSNNNILKGNVKLQDCCNSIIYSEDKTVIVDRLNDIYCVQAGNYVIIGKKDKLENIHEFRGKYDL